MLYHLHCTISRSSLWLLSFLIKIIVWIIIRMISALLHHTVRYKLYDIMAEELSCRAQKNLIIQCLMFYQEQKVGSLHHLDKHIMPLKVFYDQGWQNTSRLQYIIKYSQFTQDTHTFSCNSTSSQRHALTFREANVLVWKKLHHNCDKNATQRRTLQIINIDQFNTLVLPLCIRFDTQLKIRCGESSTQCFNTACKQHINV